MVGESREASPDASIAAIVAREPVVRAAWVFGSRARGEARRGSDLDVAVLLDPGAPSDVLTRLSGALSRHFGVEADVVDLARATPVLGFEIVSGGRRVFARDAEAADDVEEHCLREYLDTGHMRRVQHHYLYGDPL
jgi:hypothetical protein